MNIYRDGQVAARAVEEGRKAKRRLIGVVREASACDETWETMPGDDCTRRCHRCTKNVFDIGAMTVAQVEDLVAAVDADAAASWVRFYRRTDGRLLVGACPDHVERAGRRKSNHRIAGVVAAALLFLAIRFVGYERNCVSDVSSRDVRPPIGMEPPLSRE